METTKEHATLVRMPGDLILARAVHSVKRYMPKALWDRIYLWRNHQHAIQMMAINQEGDISEELDTLLQRTPVGLRGLESEMALEIANGSFRVPEARYSIRQQDDTDVCHDRYAVSIYILKYDIETQEFRPATYRKHRKYGWLAYWREGELQHADLDSAETEELHNFVEDAQEALKEAVDHRQEHDPEGDHVISLGDKLYRTIPGKTRLEPHLVLEAASRFYGDQLEAGAPYVAEYVQRFCTGKPVAESWLQDGPIHGEALVGFELADEDDFPVIVTPETVKQRLNLRAWPVPMEQVGPGVNTPDRW